jgi:O-antigen/teichoic acid export membrane protein
VHKTGSLNGAADDPELLRRLGVASAADGPVDRVTSGHQGSAANGRAQRTDGRPGRHRVGQPGAQAGLGGNMLASPAYAPRGPSAAPGRRRLGLAERRREFRAQLTSPLFRNAYALMLNTGATGLLGVVYWLLAARYYPAVDVGRATAAYSAMNFVSGLAAANILGAFTCFVPQSGHRTAAFVLRAYLLSSVASVLFAVLFMLTISHWGASYAELRGMIPALCFVVCVVAWGIFTLQDGVLIGLRSAIWVPIENGTFGVVKIVLLLAWAAAVPSLGIDISWMLPVILSLPLVNLLIFSKLIPDHQLLIGDRRPPNVRQIGRFLAGDYTGALCVLAISNLVPIAVAVYVGPQLNAYFYMAWTIGGMLFVVAVSMARSLTVEGALDNETLAANCRLALRHAMLLLAPTAALAALLAPVILGLFGSGYASYGVPILRVLAIATLPRTLTEVYLGALRAQSRAKPIAVIQIVRCVLVLGLAVALIGTMGMVGAAVAVLVAESVIAIAIVPGLRRIMSAAGQISVHRSSMTWTKDWLIW